MIASGEAQGPQFLTIKEFARLTTLSVASIYRRIRSGELPCAPRRMTGMKILIPRVALESWLPRLDAPSDEDLTGNENSQNSNAKRSGQQPSNQTDGCDRLPGPVPNWQRK